MASWGSFAAAAPAIAAKGHELFYQYGVGMGFLGTVRGDGSPRVHPICPILTDDALFALIVPGPKREDLRRDPRYALHCLTSEPPRHDDAFYLAGTVNEKLDAPTWDRVVEQFLAERGMDSPLAGIRSSDARRVLYRALPPHPHVAGGGPVFRPHRLACARSTLIVAKQAGPMTVCTDRQSHRIGALSEHVRIQLVGVVDRRYT